MRIQHNTKASNAQRNFGIQSGKLSKNLEKLSSGYKIDRAADDAAGLAVSEKMRAEITGLEAGIKNARDGIGLIQTAEGALIEVHEMLDRMYYLCDEAVNGTYSEVDRSNIQEEVMQLCDEIDRISHTANFNGVNLLDGSLDPASTDPQGEALTFQIGPSSEETLEISIGKFDSNNPLAIRYLWLGGATSQAAGDSLPNIMNAINVASGYRGKLGALQNRLEHTIQNLSVNRENLSDSESRIRDTDVAEEMMVFTKNSIMTQASQSMIAQANQDTQSVMTLLQP